MVYLPRPHGVYAPTGTRAEEKVGELYEDVWKALERNKVQHLIIVGYSNNGVSEQQIG